MGDSRPIITGMGFVPQKAAKPLHLCPFVPFVVQKNNGEAQKILPLAFQS
jgi:hypothetical protein